MINEQPRQSEQKPEYIPLSREEVQQLPRDTLIRLMNEDGRKNEFWRVVNSKSIQGRDQILIESPVLDHERLSRVLEEYYKLLANLDNHRDFAKTAEELDSKFFVGYREDISQRRPETSLRHWESIDYDRMVARKAREVGSGIDHQEAIRLAKNLVAWWTSINVNPDKVTGVRLLDEDLALRIKGDPDSFDKQTCINRTKHLFEGYISHALDELGVSKEEAGWHDIEPNATLIKDLDSVAPEQRVDAPGVDNPPTISSKKEGRVKTKTKAYQPDLRAIRELDKQSEVKESADQVEQKLTTVFAEYYQKPDDKTFVDAYDRSFTNELNKLKGQFLDAKKERSNLTYMEFVEQYLSRLSERLSAGRLVQAEQDAVVLNSDAEYFQLAKRRLNSHMATVEKRSAYTEKQKQFKQSELDRLQSELRELNTNYGDVNQRIANISERMRSAQIAYWTSDLEEWQATNHVENTTSDSRTALSEEAVSTVTTLMGGLTQLSRALRDGLRDAPADVRALSEYKRYYEWEEKIRQIESRADRLVDMQASTKPDQLVEQLVDIRHDATMVLSNLSRELGLSEILTDEIQPTAYTTSNEKTPESLWAKLELNHRIKHYLDKRNWAQWVADAGLIGTLLIGGPMINDIQRESHNFADIISARQQVLATRYDFNEVVARQPELSRMREQGATRQELAEVIATRSIAKLTYAEGASKGSQFISDDDARQTYNDLLAAQIVLGDKEFDKIAERFLTVTVVGDSSEILMSDLAKLVAKLEVADDNRTVETEASTKESNPQGDLAEVLADGEMSSSDWQQAWESWQEQVAKLDSFGTPQEQKHWLEQTLKPLANELTEKYDKLQPSLRYVVQMKLFDKDASRPGFDWSDDELMRRDNEGNSTIQQWVDIMIKVVQLKIDQAA